MQGIRRISGRGKLQLFKGENSFRRRGTRGVQKVRRLRGVQAVRGLRKMQRKLEVRWVFGRQQLQRVQSTIES